VLKQLVSTAVGIFTLLGCYVTQHSLVVIDTSGQRVGPIFKVQAVQPSWTFKKCVN